MQWSPPGVILLPKQLWPYLETFLVVITGIDAIGVYWVEARDAAKHPTQSGTGPTTRKYLYQNVNSVEIEKPWPTM